MSKQAQVGIFALVGLIAIFGVFYALSDLGTRAGGYRVGVHFITAQGLRRQANVFLSGVPIGTVESVQLEKDFTTDVVIAIKGNIDIPQRSKYVIVAPITGEPALDIIPLQTGENIAVLPHEVLPVDQQPVGTNPLTISDLLEQGTGEVKRVDAILGQLQVAEPALLKQLQSTLDNANRVTASANSDLARLSAQANTITGELATVIDTSGRNVDDLTTTLNRTAQGDAPKIDALLGQLSQTTTSLNASVDALRSVATDPKVKANLKDTAANFALTAKTLAELTNDLRQVTGNPQTQLQLRDTVANLDASAQKVNALIGQVGGTSSVYGVDAGATPLPAGFPQPAQPRSGLPSGLGTAAPLVPGASSGGGAPGAAPKKFDLTSLKTRFSNLTKDLVTLDVRVSELAPLRPGILGRNNSKLLSPDRGPQSDFNVTLLPKNGTSLVAGVNDTGGPIGATANVLLEKNTPGLTYGGGILYSQAGVLARYQKSKYFGLEARGYDLRHPTLDTYLNLFPVEKFELFGGARDVNHVDRRAVFGLQFGF